MTPHPTIRCAIYTRKSSDEGLDQEFNSLDAQHEACAAYIASQKHEGWKLAPERFDDGGLSGGTLERPALQRLLGEIEAGRIGMVVVYKIDRLTRSLADFVRLVEKLDVKGCSFVSVTQAFNTSSSMGRLTLNVLLSFAQFEREVTAERIRDKIAASKRKGLWMGGAIPLGYDRHPDPTRRELILNEGEAATVRMLFDLYQRLGNLRLVELEAQRLGLRPKVMVHPSGKRRGDGPFSRGQLHYLLRNPVYIGRIRHKEQSHPGQHPAIINQSQWETVQAKFLAARARPRGRSNAQVETRPLTGKLRDETGDLLTPTHTQRHGRRFAYYVSHRLIAGGVDPAGWRLPATALEQALRCIVSAHLREAAQTHRLLVVPDAGRAEEIGDRVQHLRGALVTDPALIGVLIERVDLGRSGAQIKLTAPHLADRIGVPAEDLAPEAITFSASLALARRGIETRIIAGDALPAPDDTLIRILAEARSWAQQLRRGIGLTDLARQVGHSEPYIRSRIALAFLSPKIQAAILEGRQPPDLTVAHLMQEQIPLDWAEQERRFGIG